MTGLDDSEVLIAREDTLTKDPFVSFILKQDTPHEIWPDVPLTAEVSPITVAAQTRC